MKRTYFSWSTGKDSALALYHLLKNKELHVDHLLTTINTHYNRVSMHGLPRSLYLEQVKSMGIPYSTVELPKQPTMEEYATLMANTVNNFRMKGYTDCGFGDIFLEDLRTYRENQLEGITCHFPLWKRDTRELYLEFLALGFKAVVVCVNGELLDASFVGRVLDQQFLEDLPLHVDPCGENGEFHTFCYDGPLFSYPVSFDLGEKVCKQYPKPNGNTGETIDYWFVDLKTKN